jgi:hypothetical protein
VPPRLAAKTFQLCPRPQLKNDCDAARRLPAQTSNWSGFVVEDPTNPFAGASNALVGGSFIVPALSGPRGCSAGAGNLHSSVWVGIDGWNSQDVFQADVSGIWIAHSEAAPIFGSNGFLTRQSKLMCPLILETSFRSAYQPISRTTP